MLTAENVLEHYSDQSGWDTDTERDLLLQFIQKHGDLARFTMFLAQAHANDVEAGTADPR